MSCLEARCPACDGIHGSVVAALDAERTQRFIEFDRLKYDGLMAEWIHTCPPEVIRCSICGHCWYRYQPNTDQLNQMYAAGKALKPDVAFSREPTERMFREMKRLWHLTGKTKLSLLDYGSGYGRWAHAGVQTGYDVCAFEPSKARGSEADVPFTLIHEEDALRGRMFDVVNLEQVLEHVPNPLNLLVSIREYCHPESVVRVTVPNILRSKDRENIWRDWPFDGQHIHVMAPFEHLHGFTPASLAKLCARAGYQPIPGYRIARAHPSYLLRRWIGDVWPTLGNTLKYLSPLS